MDDLQLPEDDFPKSSLQRKSKLPIIIGVVLVLAAAGGAIWWFLLRKEAAPTAPDAGVEVPDAAAPDLVRALAAAVNLVADGDSPRAVLGFMEPKERFSVREEVGPKTKRPPAKGKKKQPPPPRKERIFVAPKSYQRYDAITALVT